MPGRAAAVGNGEPLKAMGADLANSLGLDSRTEVRVGRRTWGAVRRMDVVATHPLPGVRLGIEGKRQGGGGTAAEKIPAILLDIGVWPIRGAVVIAGSGFSATMRGYLASTGSVVDVDDLEDWLRLHCGL